MRLPQLNIGPLPGPYEAPKAYEPPRPTHTPGMMPPARQPVQPQLPPAYAPRMMAGKPGPVMPGAPQMPGQMLNRRRPRFQAPPAGNGYWQNPYMGGQGIPMVSGMPQQYQQRQPMGNPYLPMIGF